MRPFERVRFDLRTSFSSSKLDVVVHRLSRELPRERERAKGGSTHSWRTNYNFLPTFRCIFFPSYRRGDIIFLSLVKNRLIAKKVFAAGKSLSRYLLGCRSSGQRWFEECWKRRRRWSGCWGIDKSASWRFQVSFFFFLLFPYFRIQKEIFNILLLFL